MDKRVGFVCFGEVNTPIERLQMKHDEALGVLTAMGYDLLDAGLVIDDEKYATADAAAEKLRGKILHLDRDDVDLPEDLVFIQDILTFKVYDLRVDRVIGHIRDVLTSNPAHDMYEIAGEDGRLIYIPAIKPFLKEIDMDAGIVYVESIEGLIE